MPFLSRGPSVMYVGRPPVRRSRFRWLRRGLVVVVAACAVTAVIAASPLGGGDVDLGVLPGQVAGANASPSPAAGAGAGAAAPSRPPVDAPDRDVADALRPAAPGALTGYVWPLPHGRLTLPFGPSPWGSKVVDGELFHDGVDLATFCGDRVVAAHRGSVVAAGRKYDAFMGWRGDLTAYTKRLDDKNLWSTLPIVVIIDDGNGYRSVYAHFGKVVVKAGDVVEAGELIGYEGRTGRASGCHLHYGLFSPLERNEFGIDADVVKRMKVPDAETARIDPLLVLPFRPDPTPKPSPSPSAAATPPGG